MSLTLATLIPGLILLVIGGMLFSNHSAVVSSLKAFPRSETAAKVLFGGGALWFLYNVLHLSEADFGQYRNLLLIGFGAVAVMAFSQVPDFLAVRGLSVVILLGATPLLDAAFAQYDIPQRLFMVSAVFVAIAFAIWLGAQPYRLRDFLEWMYRVPGRSRFIGAGIAAYGALLTVVAFTY